MKRILLFFVLFVAVSAATMAQKYVTKTGSVNLFSSTAVENVDARNKQVNCALDASTGDLVFKVLLKSFEFEKALMQEHFNENYVESDKFPNSTFQGKITNIKDVNFSKPGVYNVTVEGNLTLHGVTKKVSTKGTLEVKSADKVEAKAKFTLKITDYDIKIPNAVSKQINDEQNITVDVTLDKLNK